MFDFTCKENSRVTIKIRCNSPSVTTAIIRRLSLLHYPTDCDNTFILDPNKEKKTEYLGSNRVY